MSARKKIWNCILNEVWSLNYKRQRESLSLSRARDTCENHRSVNRSYRSTLSTLFLGGLNDRRGERWRRSMLWNLDFLCFAISSSPMKWVVIMSRQWSSYNPRFSFVFYQAARQNCLNFRVLCKSRQGHNSMANILNNSKTQDSRPWFFKTIQEKA